MKISIVTICYNEAANITATMESVFAQTYRNIEYIVKDGGSTDGTVDIIKKFELRITNGGQLSTTTFTFRWYSEKDGGLYKGMNAGLAKCTGDYVLFCNAGDRLAANDVIEKMVSKAESGGMPDLVYGDGEDVRNGQYLLRSAHGPGFIKFGMPATHEAMFYKLALIHRHNIKYDASYRIAADYKFTYQFVNVAKSFLYLGMPIVVFAEGDGFSVANKWLGLKETNRVRREVSGLSAPARIGVTMMQCAALVLSTYCAPLYRVIRMRKVKASL